MSEQAPNDAGEFDRLTRSLIDFGLTNTPAYTLLRELAYLGLAARRAGLTVETVRSMIGALADAIETMNELANASKDSGFTYRKVTSWHRRHVAVVNKLKERTDE